MALVGGCGESIRLAENPDVAPGGAGEHGRTVPGGQDSLRQDGHVVF